MNLLRKLLMLLEKFAEKSSSCAVQEKSSCIIPGKKSQKWKKRDARKWENYNLSWEYYKNIPFWYFFNKYATRSFSWIVEIVTKTTQIFNAGFVPNSSVLTARNHWAFLKNIKSASNAQNVSKVPTSASNS